MSKVFEQAFFASFDDSDPGGIVFFGNYYRIAHRIFEQFVIAQGLSWSDWFSGKDVVIPLVHSEADYKRPLFAGRSYLAKVQVESMGSSSMTIRYQFLTEDGSKECATLKTVHVFVEKGSMSKTDIPQNFREAFS
jgi:1,4-dihydroxy-2-naphthoyl-CoA hydrolase